MRHDPQRPPAESENSGQAEVQLPEDVVEPATLAGARTDSTTWHLTAASLEDMLGVLALPVSGLTSTVSLMGLHELGELPFEMRIGRWQIDLPTATARGVVNGVVLTATLSALGEASIPATVLSVVVPAIFDVERVSISPSQRYVYAVLLNAPVATQQDTLSVEQWYARLPARVQAELTLLEFRDIVGVLDEMGNVDLDTHGHLKVVRPSPRRVARLRLPAAPPPYEFQ